MFTKSDSDIERTINMMVDRSKHEARFNEAEAIALTAKWIRQDRRFDDLDANYLSKEAFDAKSHGRMMQLRKPAVTTSPFPPWAYNR